MKLRIRCHFCEEVFEHDTQRPTRPPPYCSEGCREKARRRRLRATGMCTRCRNRRARPHFATCVPCHDIEQRSKNRISVARRLAARCRDCGKSCSFKENGISFARCDSCRTVRTNNDRARRLEKRLEKR